MEANEVQEFAKQMKESGDEGGDPCAVSPLESQS
jgi:hypothetical protein